MSDPVRPVLLQAPQAGQKWVNADGTATHYGHRWHHAVFMRLGAYNDDVWRSLGVGFTGLTQINMVNQRVDDVEAATAAVQGAIAGLRGDPRLEDGVRALEIAVTALVQVQARASGQTEHHLEGIERLVASLGARLTKAQQAIEFQSTVMAKDALTAQRVQTGLYQRLAARQFNDEQRVDAVEEEIAGLTTDDVAEAGNLYYTNARADGRIAAAVGVSVQAYSANLDAFAAKTAPAGAVVGTTDAQTLTNKTLTAPAISSPTGIVKGDVGLGNVDNTSDAAKPVSTAQQAALDLKAPLSAPTFTGAVRVNAAYSALTGGATLGMLNIVSTTAEAAGVGATVMLGGLSEGGTYGFGAVRAVKSAIGNYGGKLIFSTVSGGAGGESNSAIYDRLVIDEAGRIIPAALPTYADNAAAVSGGLATNTLYKTSTGEVRIVV